MFILDFIFLSLPRCSPCVNFCFFLIFAFRAVSLCSFKKDEFFRSRRSRSRPTPSFKKTNKAAGKKKASLSTMVTLPSSGQAKPLPHGPPPPIKTSLSILLLSLSFSLPFLLFFFTPSHPHTPSSYTHTTLPLPPSNFHTPLPLLLHPLPPTHTLSYTYTLSLSNGQPSVCLSVCPSVASTKKTSKQVYTFLSSSLSLKHTKKLSFSRRFLSLALPPSSVSLSLPLRRTIEPKKTPLPPPVLVQKPAPSSSSSDL